MSASFDFHGRTGPGRGQRREDGDPLRVLLLADLAGLPGQPLNERCPQRIDVDSFDEVMQRVAPRVEVSAGGAPVQLSFRELDDFHPDRLIAAVPRLQAIVGLRRRLLDPQASSAAVAELRGSAPPASAGHACPSQEAEDLLRLLGKRPAERASQHEVGLQAFLQRIVAPHLVPAQDPRVPELAAALEQEAATLLRTVLHAPAFQQVEAAWRQVHQLVNEPGIDDGSVELYLLEARKAELGADESRAGGWSLIACAHGFENSSEDVITLAALGSLAQAAGAPLLAEARNFVPPTEEDAPGIELDRWRALQRSPQARWLGLLQPRILCRRQYGKTSDPIETLPFEELPLSPEQTGYLWGHAALDGARLFIQSCAAGQDVMQLDDLPSYVWPFDGRWNRVVCTEGLLSEDAADRLGELGLMSFHSHAARASVRLSRFRSLSSEPSALPCPWM